MHDETKNDKDNCQLSIVNCQLIRPCPRLFPSFTVTEGEMERYGAIRGLVARDKYLPPGYRRNGGRAKGEEGERIIADPRRYATGPGDSRPPVTEAQRLAEFALLPVLRTDLRTGETVLYDTAAECAARNCRSLPTLWRQVRRTQWHCCHYKFETVNEQLTQKASK